MKLAMSGSNSRRIVSAKLAVSAQKASREHTRADRHVFTTELHGLGDRTRRATDGQPGIPQPVLQPLGDPHDIGAELLSVEDQ
jgi:hypothetical protein